MPVTVLTSRASQPLTVNALLKAPTAIPVRILSLLQNQFVTDRILRNGGNAPGGAIQYNVSSPIFTDQASEIVAEGADIPVVSASRGDLLSKPTAKRGLAIEITREMRNRNQVGEVERQMQLVKNTLIRDVDGALVSTLQAGVTQSRVATAAWTNASTATIRKDINAAQQLVMNAALAQQANNWLGYDPTDIILNPVDATNLANSSEFLALLYGSVNPSNLAADDIDGKSLLGLTVNVSRAWPVGTAFVCERNTIGGYVDEEPLSSTALYPVTGAEQKFRNDTWRTMAGFIDQPLAGAWITGI